MTTALTPKAKDKIIKLVSIADEDDDGLTEIAWIKRQCRKHARNPNAKSAIALQALQVYLRALEVEHRITEGENSEFSKLSETERVERITRLLNLASERKGDSEALQADRTQKHRS
jgi:hypothetical protein